MDFSNINKISRLDEFMPTKKLMDLDIGKDYKVTELKMVQSKFGSQVVVGIDNAFSVFLPTRISNAFQNDRQQYQQMIETCTDNHLYIRYIGGKYNQFEFVYL